MDTIATPPLPLGLRLAAKAVRPVAAATGGRYDPARQLNLQDAGTPLYTATSFSTSITPPGGSHTDHDD